MKNKYETIKHKFTPEFIQYLRKTVGSRIPETGLIGGSSDGYHTDKAYFDSTANVSGSTYTPDKEAVDAVLALWNNENTSISVVAHSHPRGCVYPSDPDNLMFSKILAINELEYIFALIVQVHPSLDGKKAKIYCYGYRQTEDGVHFYDLGCIDEKHSEVELPAIELQESHDSVKAEREYLIPNGIDPEIMKRKTIIAIGTGGFAPVLEQKARDGIGRIIAIDGDVYEKKNLVNQAAYYSDLGLFKVDALKRRLCSINPDIEVINCARYLDDDFTDNEFEEIVGDQLFTNPKDILLCASTDSFEAQARTAGLAMKYGLPFMASQMYAGGVGAEVVFTYPGITQSCPRCVLKGRYDAYKSGYQSTVTSAGTPISSVAYANGLEGQISSMLLLYGEGDNRYTHMLDRVKDRNLVIMKISPDAEQELGINLFHNAMDETYSFFGEVAWIPQTAVSVTNGFDENCILCYGLEDLLLLKGSISDTRKVIEWKEYH